MTKSEYRAMFFLVFCFFLVFFFFVCFFVSFGYAPQLV